MSEWRDISTAPKDGTPVLLVIPENSGGHIPPIFIGAYHGEWYTYGASSSGTLWRGQPTHWQPLPAPLGEGGEEG